MKKATSLLLALILAFSLALPAAAEEAGYDVLEGGVTEIQKYGNIILDIASQDLLDAGVLSKCQYGVKILGNGSLSKKLTVRATAFSASAKEKIVAAGGKWEVV